jgi:hypothetical protein
MTTDGSVVTGCWEVGTGALMNVSGATVRAVNDRATTGERPPTLSTATIANVW